MRSWLSFDQSWSNQVNLGKKVSGHGFIRKTWVWRFLWGFEVVGPWVILDWTQLIVAKVSSTITQARV